MISMTLAEFTDVVRKLEKEHPSDQCTSDSKKSNGVSVELGQYLDSLSDAGVMALEVERLSDEATRLLKDMH